MWRLALAAIPVLTLALVLVGGVASQSQTPTATPEASASPSPSPVPSPAPPTPELLLPPPPPVDPTGGQPRPAVDPAYPGALRPGDWVRITGTDSCLNVRWEPRTPVTQPDGATYDNALNCLPDGFVGLVDGNSWGIGTSLPVNSDGRWWWHIVGQGWAADEFLAFHHQAGLPWPERPDLANAGLIAYLRSDNSVWLMDADGSNARALLAADPNRWVLTVRWSPLGDRLALALGRTDGTQVTLVVDSNGTVLREIAGLVEPNWSPSGAHLAGLKQMPSGSGAYGATPVVLDLGSGAEWVVGPPTYSHTAPVWSPDGNTLAFICTSVFVALPDGTTGIDPAHDCGGDGLRIVRADGSSTRIIMPINPQNNWYISSPSWSPSGGTIAVVSMQQGGCLGYALIDVASGAVTGCISPPGMGTTVGGGCGGPGMSAPSWTVDGLLVFSTPGAGQSGVFVQDLESGARAFIPGMSAGLVSLAPDGVNLTYDSGGYIWVAGLDGSNLTLLAEGHSPAWQPLP